MKKYFLLFNLLFICFYGFSQIDNHHLHKGINGEKIDKFYLPLEFDADSLIGFDEEAALIQAKHSGAVEEWQQKRMVAVLKRNYIDYKYALKQYGSPDPTPQAPCTNPGFETGTLAGWNAFEGSNGNSLTMAGCCAAATAQAVLVGPGFDPNVPALPTVPPGGGNFACRLGQMGTGGMSYRLNQTFTVTATNSVFIYKYAVVLQDGGHACGDQPFFNIRFETCNNVVIPCAQYQVAQQGSSCSSGDPSFQTSGSWSYLPWQTRSFDLTAYIGQCVNIEFTVGGCVASQGAHPGYCYVDASCQPMTLNLNGIDIPVGQTNSNFCNIGANTLCAPPGFTSYTWNGPGVTGQTTQCVNPSSAGSYSVTLGMAGSSCQSPVLHSNFVIVPKPNANFNFTTTPCQTTFSVPFNDASTLGGGPAITNWLWDFDNNGVVDNSTQNPSNTYTAAGTYSVELKVSNGGCVDSITKVVTITPKPTANFNFSPGCLNTPTTFTSTSTPTLGLASLVWHWGDGSANGSGTTASHTYTTAGTYPVKLVITNTSLCKDSITINVSAAPNPTVAFTSNTVCLGATTNFNNTSNVTAPSTINTWAWDFDNNGTTDNATQSPTNTFTAAGTYSVELKAITNTGCRDSLVVPVIVNANPTATFAPVNACENANVLLNNTSSIPLPNTITLYSWNFGAGSTPASSSNQNPPSLTYSGSGVKTITLSITANNSCTATVTKTVTINPAPVANFSTTSVCQSTATAFTDMSTTTTGTITSWAWDFTNDGAVDNTIQNPSFTYPTSGTVTAALTVSTNAGCSNSITAVVNIWGHTIPDFSPNNVCFGTATTFTNNTNITTNANVGTTPAYTWNFADGSGNQVLAGNPAHTYTLGGNANATYNVTLTATSSHNCVDVIQKVVNVFAIPTASFTADSVCLGSASHMLDASNGNGNGINGYQWDFLSNGTIDATGISNPNFTFPAAGNNVVTYTASTTPTVGLTCKNVTSTITVWVNPNPVPDFTFVNKCINAQPNSFDANTSSIAIGTNTNYAWAYGDGATGTGVTSTHVYATASTFNATLTVTSNKGCQVAIVKQVEVYQKPFMSITNSNACDKKAMTFTATTLAGSGTVTNWFWDFNNAIASIEATGQTSSFTFPAPGNQTVALVSETNHGCRDTIYKPIYVDYVPVPNFTVDRPSGCPVHCVNFTNTTPQITGPSQNTTWTWYYGDGTQTTANTDANQNHCYDNLSSNQLAQFNIKLVVTTSSGCTDSLTKANFITVYPTPIAAYEVNPNPGSVITPQTYFTNQSQDFTKWYWCFGDGPISDSTHLNPVHNYTSDNADSYYSYLIVKNQYGCIDTANVKIDIGPEFIFYIPNAFTPTNEDGINDVFTGKGIGIAKYEMWIFDRWGANIFYSDDIIKGWNGKVQGKSNDVQQDVYVWKVKLTDVLGKKHDYIGHVTVLR